MKIATLERFDMKEVKDFQPGEIVLNIGIIKHVFPHPSKNLIQIFFSPSRGKPQAGAAKNEHSMWYLPNDKLMKG